MLPTSQSSGHESAIVRGALVVLEGLDCSGKTTQVALLEKQFSACSKKAKVMRFPDRSTPTGQLIDAYLKGSTKLEDHVIHLLFSANRWEFADAIRALLAGGTSVICDRYYHSGILYSVAKQNPSLTMQWARAPEIGLPRPDVVLFLDIEEAAARARGGWGEELYERSDIQRRVGELFWSLSLGHLGAAFRQEREDLVIVDASASIEDVAHEIWEKLQPRIASVERGEMGSTVGTVS